MGNPATFITLLKNGKKTEMNDVTEQVRVNGHKTIVVNACINDNPEVKPLIVGLAWVGYNVIVFTDASDNIESLRSIRRCNFVLNVIPPTENQNSVNTKMLPFLQEGDELMFTLDDEERYALAIAFLNQRVVTKPTVTFMVQEGSKLMEQVIEDSRKFRFKCRILPHKLS